MAPQLVIGGRTTFVLSKTLYCIATITNEIAHGEALVGGGPQSSKSYWGLDPSTPVVATRMQDTELGAFLWATLYAAKGNSKKGGKAREMS